MHVWLFSWHAIVWSRINIRRQLYPYEGEKLTWKSFLPRVENTFHWFHALERKRDFFTSWYASVIFPFIFIYICLFHRQTNILSVRTKRESIDLPCKYLGKELTSSFSRICWIDFDISLAVFCSRAEKSLFNGWMKLSNRINIMIFWIFIDQLAVNYNDNGQSVEVPYIA